MMTRAVISGLTRRSRWPARTALTVAVSVSAMAGAALIAAPEAHADSIPDDGIAVAIDASTNELMTGQIGLSINNDGLGMWPGTSPDIAPMYNGATGDLLGDQVAFQANTSTLWTAGPLGTGSLNLGMMPGTSPSITGLTYGGYQIAFQANTGDLWTVGSDGTVNWGLPMNPYSSPSITSQPGGAYEVAYEASNGELSVAGNTSTGGLGLGMQPGTSPSITDATGAGGGYEIAFQANTSALWIAGNLGTGSTGQGMNPASSPAITIVSDGTTNSYQIAFEANTNQLFTWGLLGNANLGLSMQPGTSPSITSTLTDDEGWFGPLPPIPGYAIGFQSNAGTLSLTGSDLGTTNTGVLMNSQSSPSINCPY
jgi:hypothetical protein